MTTNDKTGGPAFPVGTEWNSSMEGRYMELVAKEAVGSITIEDELELDRLAQLRRERVMKDMGQ